MKPLACRIAGALLAAMVATAASAQCGVILFFAPGQSAVSPQGQHALAQFAVSRPQGGVVVNGYSDASGNAAANQRLSLARARNVAAQLQRAAPAGFAISAVNGYGAAVRPGTAGPLDPRNRRVEVLARGCLRTGPTDPDAIAAANITAGAGGIGVLLAVALAAGLADHDSSTGTD